MGSGGGALEDGHWLIELLLGREEETEEVKGSVGAQNAQAHEKS